MGNKSHDKNALDLADTLGVVGEFDRGDGFKCLQMIRQGNEVFGGQVAMDGYTRIDRGCCIVHEEFLGIEAACDVVAAADGTATKTFNDPSSSAYVFGQLRMITKAASDDWRVHFPSNLTFTTAGYHLFHMAITTPDVLPLAVSADYELVFGLSSETQFDISDNTNNGIGFKLSTASANFETITNAGSVVTKDSGVAIGTIKRKILSIEVYNDGGFRTNFYINGVKVTEHTSVTPSARMFFGGGLIANAITADITVFFDVLHYYAEFTGGLRRAT